MSGVQLNAKWQLDAAMLSRPVDLTALVSLSQSDPEQFFEDKVAHLLVSRLLNNSDVRCADKDTKLDVLTILGNLAALPQRRYKEELKAVLQGVNKWFDEYLFETEVQPNSDLRLVGEEDSDRVSGRNEPDLHKAMLVLLARTFEYSLKAEDLLELTAQNRTLALELIVSLLEEGETYTTELTQRLAPGSGSGPAQWEHQLVCKRHERPLVLQMCRLLKGFTNPSTYFSDSRQLADSKCEEHDVRDFCKEMATLADTTIQSHLVEKLSVALHECLFQEDAIAQDGNPEASYDEAPLCDADHLAIVALHDFLQNLYTYAADASSDFRRHVLTETLLIPRLVLPYLDRCAVEAELLCKGDTRNGNGSGGVVDAAAGDEIAAANVSGAYPDKPVLDKPTLVRGIAASLRTLVIASFRAPPTRFVLGLLRRLNPTASLLRASDFIAHNDYLIALICLVNVNLGALDVSRRRDPQQSETLEADGSADRDGADGTGKAPVEEVSDGIAEAYYATILSSQLKAVVGRLRDEQKSELLYRLRRSSALPVMRDTPSFVEMTKILTESSSQSPLEKGASKDDEDGVRGVSPHNIGENRAFQQSRTEAKAAAASRIREQEFKRQHHDHVSKKDTADARGSAMRKASEFRLLGDLPPIQQRWAKERVPVELAVPELGRKRKSRARKQGRREKRHQEVSSKFADEKEARNQSYSPANSAGSSNASRAATSLSVLDKVPAEFACSINGHLLRAPVKSPGGHVFERETILLWLQTRGFVCPISGDRLTPEDLSEDLDLRQQIVRWQISNLLTSNQQSDLDDPYDF